VIGGKTFQEATVKNSYPKNHEIMVLNQFGLLKLFSTFILIFFIQNLILITDSEVEVLDANYSNNFIIHYNTCFNSCACDIIGRFPTVNILVSFSFWRFSYIPTIYLNDHIHCSHI
jgi:hypothetical protein